MAISPDRLKALAIEMAAAMPAPPPRRMEIVAGAMVSHESMEIARAYEAATAVQKAAMHALIACWKPQ